MSEYTEVEAREQQQIRHTRRGRWVGQCSCFRIGIGPIKFKHRNSKLIGPTVHPTYEVPNLEVFNSLISWCDFLSRMDEHIAVNHANKGRVSSDFRDVAAVIPHSHEVFQIICEAAVPANVL